MLNWLNRILAKDWPRTSISVVDGEEFDQISRVGGFSLNQLRIPAKTGLSQEEGSGLPWWSSGLDSALPLQEAQVRSLVRELRSHMPRGTAKKKKEEGSEEPD